VEKDFKKLEEELNIVRSKIDLVDERLKYLLKERFQLIEKIVEIKKELKADYFDSKREYNIYKMLEQDLPQDKIKPLQNIFERILDESRAFQRKILIQKSSADAKNK
jgi:chorismate mutase